MINTIVDKIWAEWDKDNSGELDKDETREFLQHVFKDMPGHAYDDSKFDETFSAIDANGDGLMQKSELAYFIRVLLKQ